MSVLQRQHTSPIVVEAQEAANVRVLSPVPLSEHAVNEGLLQNLLATYPTLIPIDEIDPGLGPLFCLGREVQTPAGLLDILYVSPEGYLTLVETKLWRNPEARRSVVGQIIDYAKELSQWSYQELEEAVRRSSDSCVEGNGGIAQALVDDGYDIDEATFVDSVSKNMRKGYFLLLVAGDGIRGDVESMAAFIQKTPNLHFNLVLLELALYRLEEDRDWPLYVQPRLVTKTAEVTRAVVEIKGAEGRAVEVTLPQASEKGNTYRRRTITEEVFYEDLTAATDEQTATAVAELGESLQELGVEPHWRASSVSYRFPDPKDTGRHFTVVVLKTGGKFMLGYLSRLNVSGGYSVATWEPYIQKVASVTGAKIKTKNPDATFDHPIEHLLANKDRFLALVSELLDRIKNEAGKQ